MLILLYKLTFNECLSLFFFWIVDQRSFEVVFQREFVLERWNSEDFVYCVLFAVVAWCFQKLGFKGLKAFGEFFEAIFRINSVMIYFQELKDKWVRRKFRRFRHTSEESGKCLFSIPERLFIKTRLFCWWSQWWNKALPKRHKQNTPQMIKIRF